MKKYYDQEAGHGQLAERVCRVFTHGRASDTTMVPPNPTQATCRHRRSRVTGWRGRLVELHCYKNDDSDSYDNDNDASDCRLYTHPMSG